MSIRDKAVKGIVWSAIENWGSQAGSLLVFFVLARLLKPEAFGLVAFASIFLAFMQIFLNQGFAQALVQRRELDPEHLDTAFWTNLTIGVALTLIGYTSASPIAQLFRQPELAPILQGFSLLCIITAFGNVQQAILERNLAFRAIALRSLLGTLVGGCVGLIAAISGLGVWSLVYQQIVQELVGTVMLWRASNWRPGLKFSLPHLQHLFGFGISLLGFNLLNFLNTRADDFLIGYFLGPVPLGYYTIAYRILSVMTQVLLSAGTKVALPTFSRLQQDPEQFRQAFHTATQLTSVVAFPIFLGMTVLAPEFVVLFFGSQWTPSIPVLQVLSLAGIFKAVAFFKGSVFIAMGKPIWTFWFGLLNATLNLAGFAIAIRWGIVAVACAYVIRGYLVLPISQWFVSRLIQISFFKYFHNFFIPLISSLIMVTVMLMTKFFLSQLLNQQMLLAVCIAIGIFSYGLVLRWLSPKLFLKLQEFLNIVLTRSKAQNI
ncbi:MOP flippase family protein [Chamaesiphon polymorphus]|uniref:Colanic acid exporter n=1 Tax=Chamaesiphon polymorphus CCALA 037 TaxID=2107692 RepID=A0A2T1FWN7_9CYAN|nr:MOP flippase family protein [Chamaesiphon polymorphus]PSB49413.1 colanic acid exporter [Chamaesiphon polymorphus CCALA 037]